MTYEEIVEKNLTLSFEFSLYLAEHPDFASRIPPNARVVLLPKYDPELAQINRSAAESGQELDDEPGRPVVHIEVEKLLPARSRLVSPRLVSPTPIALRTAERNDQAT